MATRRQREGKGPVSQYPLRGYALQMLNSFQWSHLLKVTAFPNSSPLTQSLGDVQNLNCRMVIKKIDVQMIQAQQGLN